MKLLCFAVMWNGPMIKAAELIGNEKLTLSLIGISFVTGVFFDLSIELGVAAGVVYIFPVLLTSIVESKKVTYWTIAFGVFLTLLGYLLSAPGGEQWKVLLNRFLAVFAIISVGTVIILIKDKTHKLAVQTRIALEAQNEAQTANKAKTEFLSSMSHQFRSPLNVIIGFSQVMQLNELTDDHRENIKYISEAGTSLLALINGVIAYVEVKDEMRHIEYEKFNIVETIAELKQLHQYLAQQKGIEIELEIIENFTIKHIQTDRGVLKEILSAFIDNAIRYNHETGTVLIRLKLTEDKAIRISVSDSGVGISVKRIPLLFKPFSRLGLENSSQPGAGLSLAKVKGLAKLLDISVGFYPNPEGSTFWVDVPFSVKGR